MENKIEKILFSTILEGSELYRVTDDIKDLFESEMEKLLEFVMKNYPVKINDYSGHIYEWSDGKTTGITIKEIIEEYSKSKI